MKLSCNRDEFYTALSGVSRAVSGKSAIPAIEGILINARSTGVTLTGYDLEIGIKTVIDAKVDENGDAVINAKLLLEMIRRMDSEQVTLECDEKQKIRLTGGITAFNFTGLAPEEFPELPSLNSENVLTVKGQTLKEMIDRTLFAVAATDQKPVHTGSKFFLGVGELTVVSVDGYRLAVCARQVENGEERSFVVPAKTLSEVSRIIGDGEEDVGISTAKRYAVFKIGEYTIITRLLEGEFLDYKRAIPDGYATRVKVNVSQLTGAVERASLIITDRFRSPIKLRFEPGRASVTCVTTLGDAYDEIDAEVEGEPVEIGFNNRYVLDALRNSGKDELYFEITSPVSPMKVRPIDSEDFLFLVLPVRIKAEQQD